MTVICLRNKQNQQGLSTSHQDSSNDDKKEEGDEAIKTSTKRELRKEETGIYSSDSDEAEENKSQTLPRAKQVTSD